MRMVFHPFFFFFPRDLHLMLVYSKPPVKKKIELFPTRHTWLRLFFGVISSLVYPLVQASCNFYNVVYLSIPGKVCTPNGVFLTLILVRDCGIRRRLVVWSTSPQPLSPSLLIRLHTRQPLPCPSSYIHWLGNAI